MPTKKITQLIEIKPTPVYYANDKAYKQGWPIICNEGGTRSSKTYSTVQLLIKLMLQKKVETISIVSHSLPHIKRGAYRDFRSIMLGMDLWDDKKFSYSDFIYYFDDERYIELFGLEDETKARGPGRQLLYINEANLIKKALFDQLAMRTTGQIFMDWNPADFNSWVYQVADDPKNKLIKSTYKNNLSNLSRSQIALIESYRDLPDSFMWDVYGLGKRGTSTETIYTSWKIYNEDIVGADTFYGLDFGYVHPCALVKISHKDGVNYAEEKLYESGLKIGDLIERLKVLIEPGATIYADAAEPGMIQEIYDAGFNIYPAKKDVWTGILKVKSMPLFINSNSLNLKNEISTYKWKKDKADNVLEEPVKANDDIMDAMRYAIYTYFSSLISLPTTF